ncbi:MAG: hypothetical protein AAF552_07870 [Pseudomonadota bacterium]
MSSKDPNGPSIGTEQDDEQHAEAALLRRLAALPKEREVGADLWPAIAQRLEPVARPPAAAPVSERRWSLRSAVAAMAVAGLASMLLNLSGESPQPAVGGNLPMLSASAEIEYSGALQDLLPLTVSAGTPAPGTPLADFEQSLAIVRDAAVAVRVALERDPQSRYLNSMLTSLQHRELNVLKEMARHADDTIAGSTT